MTAQPVPTPAPDRAPDVSEALTVLRDYGVPQLHRFGGKRSGKALERVLHYVASLEQSERAERQRRTEFEAQAEGEFAELRLQVRTWQTYAAQLEEQGGELRSRLISVVEALDTWLRLPWWRWRARRRQFTTLNWDCNRGDDYARNEPTPTLPPVNLVQAAVLSVNETAVDRDA